MTWYVVTKDVPGHIKRIGEDADHATTDKTHAKQLLALYGGHIVELVEKPEPVVVSEAEAEMLAIAKASYGYGAGQIATYAAEHHISLANETRSEMEDRLMRACVNGWEVEKPKRYLIKVPHTDDSYFYKIDDEYCNAGDSYHLEGMTDKKWFTLAEIEHYGLHDCEKVEVADND